MGGDDEKTSFKKTSIMFSHIGSILITRKQRNIITNDMNHDIGDIGGLYNRKTES